MDYLTDDRKLRPSDALVLVVLCAALALPAWLDGRGLTTHEATHCLNVREMFDSGDFLIPTYGGRPWLERPPVPHWLTGIPAALAADCSTPWAMRVGPAIAACGAVLALAWGVATALGRWLGLMSGAILATTREWAAYAVGAEADIFLAATVTVAGALVLRAEFGPAGGRPEQVTFFGPRPWPVLGVFVVLGATNAMKGPLFGTAFVVSALAVYLLAGRHWDALRRYFWFWGWLAYVAVGALWPIVSYLRYPDVADLWMNDYGKRLSEGYIGAPPWYYLVHVPWNLFPWTLAALVGLAVTARRVLREGDRPWQFLWAWALVPAVAFSAFDGKHHHYMLNCMAPWGPLAAAGAVALWRVARDWHGWVRSPLFGLLILGAPGAGAALAFAKKIPGPDWIGVAVAVGWAVVATAGWTFATHRDGRVAFVGLAAVIVVAHTAAGLHRTAYLDRYDDDRAFLAEVKTIVPAEAPLFVLNEPHPLNAAWVLYELGPRAHLLHHPTFLSSDRITAPEAYVVGRRYDRPILAGYGEVTAVAESARTRAESSPMDRYTLYRLRFFPDLQRHPEPPVNGMQATGRSPGPILPGPVRR
jgi:4-amino-4-deoxy-L-arabinose transferase-like glycosyltransferase